MRLLFVFFIVVFSTFETKAITQAEWWNLCGQSAEGSDTEAVCRLTVSAIESGIKAQATMNAVDNGKRHLSNSELAKIYGFCYSASASESVPLKFNIFKTYVSTLIEKKTFLEADIGLVYHIWFTERYLVSKCQTE